MSEKISKRQRLVLATLIGAAAYSASYAASAADTSTASQPPLEEVIITGTSIKQNLDNTSLPVTVITSEQIAKSGQTSITDLIQNLPAMQGFVPASSSVNGGGGGGTTAAVHGLPSKYTLTLVDGQRIAPFGLGAVQGGGFGVNIESIPLDAVERVEVLTDGASALYGADAISGVVNFILKKNQTNATAYYNVSVPNSAGGSGWDAGISKGFGSMADDGYNVLVTYSHDVQDKLQASQRAVSRTGAVAPFTAGGQNLLMFAPTGNTEPANVTIGSLNVTYNPFYQANGNCGNANAFPLTTAAGLNCRFNFAATVQDIPPSIRDSGMIKGNFKVSENNSVWAEVLVSKYTTSPQYAPPAQPLSLSPTRLPALWNKYVVPYLVANNKTYPGDGSGCVATVTVAGQTKCNASRATLNYRAVSAGGRADDYITEARQIAFGWNGKVAGWDLNATGVVSHGRFTDNAAGGFLDGDQFSTAVASGAYDPVTGVGQSALQSAILHSNFSHTYTDLNSIAVNGQHPLFDLSGGPSILSLGAEFDSYKYATQNSDLNRANSGFSTQPASGDTIIGGGGGAVDVEADRNNWGLFGEWLLPIEKNLDVTASVRYDSYDKVHSTTIFADQADPVTGLQNQLPSGNLGNTFSQATGKLSFRYTPINEVTIRGSYGTGFKAPNLTDIAGVLSFAGSTSGTYPCPIPGSAGCLPGSAQYDLLSGPNGKSGSAGLKPEKSTQWTLGVKYQPMPQLFLGLDYWNVTLKDQVESAGIAEQLGFNNPVQYAALFKDLYVDPVGGFQTIAFEQLPFNGGSAHFSGLDWRFDFHSYFDWGKFTASLSGTQMLKQDYTNFQGGPLLTDLGVYGPDQQVVFRTQASLQLGLETGKWTNTLTAHYKSGYKDQAFLDTDQVVFQALAGGLPGNPVTFAGLDVPAFTTFDWQTNYELLKSLNVTFGIKNIGDKAPPLSLQQGGGGNQRGYDGRYYDPTGRVYYFKGTVRF